MRKFVSLNGIWPEGSKFRALLNISAEDLERLWPRMEVFQVELADKRPGLGVVVKGKFLVLNISVDTDASEAMREKADLRVSLGEELVNVTNGVLARLLA